MNEMRDSGILIYQAEDGSAMIDVRLQGETLWLSQEQLAQLFDVQKAAISKHLKNIYASGELERGATVSKMETVRQEGTRSVVRQTEHYNLNATISVGYRVNSARATRFRQWATRTLREHLTQGYTLNRQRLETNAGELEAALLLVRKAVQSPDLLADAGRGMVDIVTRYVHTFVLLQRYDEGLLTELAQQPGGVLQTLDEALAGVARLKAELIARGEATELFARQRGDAFAALLGNLEQSVFGEPAYPSVEAKAAHLLYFVIPPLRRRQQAQRRLPVRGLPQPQRPPARRPGPAGHQRHRPRRAGPAGGGVRPGAEGNPDPPDHEHARTGTAARRVKGQGRSARLRHIAMRLNAHLRGAGLATFGGTAHFVGAALAAWQFARSV